MTLNPSALEPAPGLPEGSEKWAARVCGTTKRLSVPPGARDQFAGGSLAEPPSCVPLCLLAGTRKLVARTRWKKSGLHWHFGGLWPYPQFTLPLCLDVSPPGCVFPCTEQRGSASPCQRAGVAVPTLYWHLQS